MFVYARDDCIFYSEGKVDNMLRRLYTGKANKNFEDISRTAHRIFLIFGYLVQMAILPTMFYSILRNFSESLKMYFFSDNFSHYEEISKLLTPNWYIF